MLYRFIIKFVAIFTFFPLGVYAQATNNACLLNLMPCPQNVTLDDGYYAFNQQVDIYIEGMSDERQHAALARSQKQLERLINIDFANFNLVKSKKLAEIILIVQGGMDRQNNSESAYRLPALGDDESYQLTIDRTLISIQSNSDFGANHALTTLIQLISIADENFNPANAETGLPTLKLPQLQIVDKPRFKWRGLLIDSVRHFIPISDIKRQLNGMAAAKLNVFHWHLTDDQGWRIESKRYPKLHQMASDNLFYTQQEIRDVVAYASLLGIRVVPEFDVPGHASAIAVAYPELMAEKKQYAMERQWGVFEPVLDVSDEKVYQFIDAIVGELASLFPDRYVHIGGDEVNPKQWLNNDNIKQLMNNEKLKTSYDLHHYFNVKAQAILSKHQRKMMGWDEIYHPDLAKDIVIQSWRGLESLNRFTNQGYQGVLSTGFYIDQPQYSDYHYRNDPIASSDFYISFVNADTHRTWQLTIPRLKGSDVVGSFILATTMNGSKAPSLNGFLKLNNNSYQQVSLLATEERLIFSLDSWMGPLRFEIDSAQAPTLTDTAPANTPNNRVFIGNAFYPLIAQELNDLRFPDIALAPQISIEQSNNILGAEATLWSEMVTKDNIDLRTWPRLFVIAERLWSKQQLSDVDNMYQRLFFMDGYSANIIGLLHNKQMLNGFSNFLGNANTKQNIDALMRLAQLVEPAHYYTRHHIKYQQDKYHQLAPLDSFVDFLPVESYALIKLDNMIRAYQQGNTSVLTDIKSLLKAWQKNEKTLNSFILKDPQFVELIPLINDVTEFNQAAMKIVELCIGEAALPEDTSLPKDTIASVNKKLNQLQEQQNEVVLSAIPLFQQLMTSCLNFTYSEAELSK